MRLAAFLCFALAFASLAYAQGFYTANPTTPNAILATSRLGIMGGANVADSNGTDTGSNSRIATNNMTGAQITRLRCYYTNWKGVASVPVEHDNTNPITITASVEYPAGTFSQILFSASGSATLATGATLESDELSVAIPTYAQFFLRTYITVTSGQIWNRLYGAAVSGEAVDAGTSTTDKTLGGTITNVGGSFGYGPVGCKATGFVGNPKQIAFVGVGDSIIAGGGDNNRDSVGNTAYFGRAVGYWTATATGLQMPYSNFGISGDKAFGNSLTGALTKRLALMSMMGVTHVFTNYGVNDLVGGTNAVTLEGYQSLIWNTLNTAGFKVIAATVTPVTTSMDSWATVVNQTVFGGSMGAGPTSERALDNAYIRSLPAPLFKFIEIASVAESSVDSGIWTINGAWTNPAYTTDGTHPSNTNNATQQGAVFPLRDATITELRTWCGC